ncbi:MAG: hypothetical protein N2B57_06590 [Planctomycetales bacterium]
MEQIVCHLLADPPMPGTVNMAIDETLLQTVSNTRIPVLRFYTWSEPTLSLGYFQSFSDRNNHQESLSCPIVRRTTGGGAILHDRELTYSLSWPKGQRPRPFDQKTKGAEWMYAWVHQALMDVLSEMGADVQFCKPTSPSEKPFLCFERRSSWDVGFENVKILGSAQRSYRGGVLQHGSLLLSSSMLTPQLSGLSEQGFSCPIDTLRSRWSARIAAKADLQVEQIALSSDQKCSALQLAEEKYGNLKWIKKR